MEVDIQKKGTLPPPVQELLRIQELEHGRDHLKQKMLELRIAAVLKKAGGKTSNPVSSGQPCQSTGGGAAASSSTFPHCASLRRGSHKVGVDYGDEASRHAAVKLTEAQYLNILESIDQPIHIINANGLVIYRNRTWDKFYGYTAAETLGKAIVELVIEHKDAPMANDIIQEMLKGESWIGEFPIKNKRGERFVVFGSNKPFCDENGKIIGIICVSAAPRPYQETRPGPSVGAPRRIASEKRGIDSQQPLQTAIASKISDLLNIRIIYLPLCLFR